MKTERELIEQAKAGDRGALEELLANQEKTIFGFANRMCGDEDRAREVLQETMLSLVTKLDSFRGDSSLSTWLFSIARNHCRRENRNGTRVLPVEPLDLEERTEETSPAANAEHSLIDRELEQRVRAALLSLEPGQREALVLRDIEGLSAEETAQVLGQSVSAVKSSLHRARRTLRERLVADPKAPLPGCPDVLDLYSKHLEGEIGPELCRSMEAHLADCPHCARECGALKRSLRLCSASKTLEEVPAAVRASVRGLLRTELGVDVG